MALLDCCPAHHKDQAADFHSGSLGSGATLTYETNTGLPPWGLGFITLANAAASSSIGLWSGSTATITVRSFFKPPNPGTTATFLTFARSNGGAAGSSTDLQMSCPSNANWQMRLNCIGTTGSVVIAGNRINNGVDWMIYEYQLDNNANLARLRVWDFSGSTLLAAYDSGTVPVAFSANFTDAIYLTQANRTWLFSQALVTDTGAGTDIPYPLVVQTLTPDSDDTVDALWVPSAGAVYDTVNEVFLDNGTSDYSRMSGGVGGQSNKDARLNMAAPGPAGVGMDPTPLVGLSVGYKARATVAATSATVAASIWDQAGTRTNGAANSVVSAGNWVTRRKQVFNGGARSIADVEAFDIGWRGSVAALFDVDVSAVWLDTVLDPSSVTSDSGSGADTHTAVGHAATDSGSGADTYTELGFGTTPDTGSGADSHTQLDMMVLDAATGDDSQVDLGRSVVDSGSGDDPHAQFDREALDSGLGYDAIAELGRILTDSGSAADLLGEFGIVMTDSGSGADAYTEKGMTALDDGAGADEYLAVGLVATDASSGDCPDCPPVTGRRLVLVVDD